MARYTENAAYFFDSKAFAETVAKLKARESVVARKLADAINFTAEEVVHLSIEEWNSYFTIRDAGYIGARLKVARKATASKLEAAVWARARATRADNFRYHVVPGRKGVYLNTVRTKPGGIISKAFVIPRAKSNGKPLIVKRLKDYVPGEARDFKHHGEEISRNFNRYRKAKDPRFKAVYAPSVNQHFYDSRDRVAPKALSEAKQQFLKAINA